METAEGDEEPGFGSSASKSNLREDSPLTPLYSGCLKVQENISPRCAVGRKHFLMEIFSVEIFEKEYLLGINQILDQNLVLTTHHNGSEYILYDVSCNKSMEINSEGHLILQWPERCIEIKDMISIRPDYDPVCRIDMPLTLWTSSYMPNYSEISDCFMSELLETRNGFLVVNYAVYSDGLEAKVDVILSDLEILGMPLAVYGTVTASNSAIPHSQAKSLLFDHRTHTDGVILAHSLAGETEIALPLSRRVTAIPRQSSLIVDINLFVRDVSIANGSITFHAKTRSNTIAEDQILFGNHGKVKVKVTWMEVVGYGGSSKEEEDERVEEEEEEWVEEEEEEWVEEEHHVQSEGDEAAESKFVFDDDSFRSLKAQCLNTQEDVSTKSSDYTIKEATMMEKDGNEEASSDSKPLRRVKRSLLEVFSIKIVDSKNVDHDEIYGLIMIDAPTPPCLLFRRVRGDPPKINSQGFLFLEGPKRLAWSVCGQVFIVPFLLKYQGFKFEDEKTWAHYLWHNSEYDKVLCKKFDNEVGGIEVNFAVYKEGVEAHLEIMLIGHSFVLAEAYGTVSARNSMLKEPKASSIVFKKERKDVDVSVRSSNVLALPLSRPIIALPFGSCLELLFDFYSQGRPIKCPQFVCPIELGMLERILVGDRCIFIIRVSFFNEQSSQSVDYEGYF